MDSAVEAQEFAPWKPETEGGAGLAGEKNTAVLQLRQVDPPDVHLKEQFTQQRKVSH